MDVLDIVNLNLSLLFLFNSDEVTKTGLMDSWRGVWLS